MFIYIYTVYICMYIHISPFSHGFPLGFCMGFPRDSPWPLPFQAEPRIWGRSNSEPCPPLGLKALHASAELYHVSAWTIGIQYDSTGKMDEHGGIIRDPGIRWRSDSLTSNRSQGRKGSVSIAGHPLGGYFSAFTLSKLLDIWRMWDVSPSKTWWNGVFGLVLV